MKKVILICLMATGCSTTFSRPDYTEEMFQEHHTDCEAKAGQAGYGGMYRRDFIQRCMIGKGWKVE